LSELRTARDGATLFLAAYEYDAVGNPVGVSSSNSVVTYGYDQRDRLTEACYQASCAAGDDPFIRYGYDPVGNRTSEARPTGTTAYSYDDADQLVSAGGPGGTTAYEFDADGRQIQAGARSFSWDQADRLTATSEGGETVSYTSDGDGNRLQADTPTGVTNYLWDVNNTLPQLALERDGSGNQRRGYLYGRERISMDAEGSSHYYARDALGSTTNLTSQDGDTEWTYSYEPFGASRTTVQSDPEAPENPIRYAGEQLTSTGLYNSAPANTTP
jgi:YD repeat-containing protein